ALSTLSLHDALPISHRRLVRGSPPLDEAVVLFFRPVPRVTVPLLEQTDDLIGATLDAVQVIVREVAPLLLHLPLHLLPFPLQDVGVHGSVPFSAGASTPPDVGRLPGPIGAPLGPRCCSPRRERKPCAVTTGRQRGPRFAGTRDRARKSYREAPRPSGSRDRCDAVFKRERA